MTHAGDIPRMHSVAHMQPIGPNEQLARLLEIQGGLLDAQLEQNMGARFGYAILVWDTSAPARLRAVTNLATTAPLRPPLRDLAAIIAAQTVPGYVQRAPHFVHGIAPDVTR